MSADVKRGVQQPAVSYRYQHDESPHHEYSIDWECASAVNLGDPVVEGKALVPRKSKYLSCR